MCAAICSHATLLAAIPRFVHPDTPPQILDEIRAFPDKPLISVLAGKENAAYISCVLEQYYPYWELCIYGDLEQYRGADPRIKVVTGTLDDAVEISTGDYLLRLNGSISPEFLFEIVKKQQFEALVKKSEV